jgi:hypothetical protein
MFTEYIKLLKESESGNKVIKLAYITETDNEKFLPLLFLIPNKKSMSVRRTRHNDT